MRSNYQQDATAIRSKNGYTTSLNLNDEDGYHIALIEYSFLFDLSLFNSDTTVVYHKIYNVVFFIAGTGQYCATYCMSSCLSVADE